jgi:hypothetical protein
MTPDDPGLAALVGIASFWHEAQHRYDRASPYRRGSEDLGPSLPMSIEMEKRGWSAGCRFWKAGVAVLLRPTGEDWPQPYFCEDQFPALYYCRLYLSEEIVILTAHQLRALGRARSQVVADLSPEAGSPGEAPRPPISPFETILAAYCGEYERALRGNPLALEGFSPQWNAGECLDRAVRTVLDPAWRSSMEQCPAKHPPGPDLREAARELQRWR